MPKLITIFLNHLLGIKGTLDVGNGPAAAMTLPILVGMAMNTKTTSKTKNISKAGRTAL